MQFKKYRFRMLMTLKINALSKILNNKRLLRKYINNTLIKTSLSNLECLNVK